MIFSIPDNQDIRMHAVFNIALYVRQFMQIGEMAYFQALIQKL